MNKEQIILGLFKKIASNCCFATDEQLDDLINTLQVISDDFDLLTESNCVATLENLGFTCIPKEVQM